MPDVKVANIQLSAAACQDTQETHSMHVASVSSLKSLYHTCVP